MLLQYYQGFYSLKLPHKEIVSLPVRSYTDLSTFESSYDIYISKCCCLFKQQYL